MRSNGKEHGLKTKCVGYISGALHYIYSSNNFSKNIDLLISDIELPDITGIELIKTIKSCRQKNSIPSIAISSNQNYKSKALNAGFDVFISKPITEQALENALKHLGTNLPDNHCARRKATC